MNLEDIFGPVIHSYSRAQAIADGVLVDVSKDSREAGISFPVALTRAVWDSYVRVPEGVDGQDETGRLWDIIWMFRCSINKCDGDRVDFEVLVRNHNGELRKSDLIQLYGICGPGDDHEPVITIMLPHED